MSDLTVSRGGPLAVLTRPVSRPTWLWVPAWWRWPAACVLAFATLPRGVSWPGTSADDSWRAGLAVVQEQGLHFGRDVVFTYGPLGFLTTSNVYVPWQALTGMVVAIALQVLLCWTLLHVSRALPVLAAVALTCVVAAAPTTEVEVGLAIVLALGLSLLASDNAVPRWLPAAGGAFAGVLLLVTPTVGVEALAVAALVSLFGRAGRLLSLAEMLVSFLIAFGLFWFATGNAIGDVLPWLRGTAQLVSGYTAGMAVNNPAHPGEVRQALALLVLLSALVVLSARGLPRLRQAALLLAWAVVGFGVFKEGFVRLDSHAAIFFATCAVAGMALARGRVVRFAAGGVAVLACSWSFASVGLGMPLALNDYVTHVNHIATDVHLLATPSKQDAVMAAGRAVIVDSLRLPRAVSRDLRTHTVDVQPTETSAAWALGVRWRPEPVFQGYAVLTPALDRLDADFLASTRAPERVLRVHPTIGIDGRNPAFDAPAAFLALVCNYRETFVSRYVEVLAHSTNRCGTPRLLARNDVAPGTLVRVPHAGADELVVARVHIPRPLTERLRELVWKPSVTPQIVLDGATFTLVTATASGPLLMRLPRSAGIAPSTVADPQVDAFRLLHVPGPVRVDFYAVPRHD